jgi:hypothetical protein
MRSCPSSEVSQKTAFGAEAGVIYQQFKIRRRRDARFDPGQIAFQR